MAHPRNWKPRRSATSRERRPLACDTAVWGGGYPALTDGRKMVLVAYATENEPPGVAGRRVLVSTGHVEGLAVGEPARLALPDMGKRSRGSLG